MSTISSQEIVSIIKSEIENFSMHAGQEQETDSIIWVEDSIAVVYDIERAMYGEIVVFENGVKGMVQDIRENEVGCILSGKDTGVGQDTKIVRIRERAGVPVGDGFLGRVVNALGEPIDRLGPVEEEDYLPVGEETPGIVSRKSVGVPMETGILAIDSMFPIGRGQRELIIGDRQTGKTSITMDTISNQEGRDMVCIYVTIGQKASTMAKLVSTLKKNGAMDYTIIMSSAISEAAPPQYMAPYTGTAMAEYFMRQGRDVLTVYDDLSKHAVAYRTLSLLLERSPSREAYPDDVFYLHSRLLEHSNRLCDEKEGGSITTLPIVETRAGDVSAHIPADVISITDGQTFLKDNLFFSGVRPAVSVGLSVSCIGGAAQTEAIKKTSGSVRIDLARYQKIEVFTQFSSGLDKATKEQLAYGKRLIELLKQPLGRPLNLHEQVITLCTATRKIMFSVEISDTKEFQVNMLAWSDEKYPEIGKEIDKTKVLNDGPIKRIVDTANECKTDQYKASIWPGRRS